VNLPKGLHPKTRVTVELVSKLLEKEVREADRQGWVGKVLIFTTYVGADQPDDVPGDERAHGTAAVLKRALSDRLMRRFQRSTRKVRRRIAARLERVLDRAETGLEAYERQRLQRTLRVFAGSAPARLLLSDDARLRVEATELRRLLGGVDRRVTAASGHGQGERASGHSVAGDRVGKRGHRQADEERRRLDAGRTRRVQQILERYSTRDLVARYDGATRPEERDRHLHGFNSPFAPLVLIASSVGQEGVDLQRYCRHVVHYDLEWNPARLEQREGRVDRQGRLTDGAVSVYFLLCGGTYDERIMHVMVNRFRWHQILLGGRAKLEAAPEQASDALASPKLVRRIRLDLRPTPAR
jgi:hypothetical protein